MGDKEPSDSSTTSYASLSLKKRTLGSVFPRTLTIDDAVESIFDGNGGCSNGHGTHVQIDSAQTYDAVVPAILHRMDQLKYSDRAKNAVCVATCESLANALTHGIENDYAHGAIDVFYNITPQQAEVVVRNPGSAFDPKSVVDPRVNGDGLTHGRGLFLMLQYMDKVTYNAKGNCVRMVRGRHSNKPYVKD
jgi:anti-sigma regulatory factor (Ser/Thr protein kinase)